MNTDTQRGLPELDPRRIDQMEAALFADIVVERNARRRRRRRVWSGVGAAAAVVVVAAVIAPSIVGSLGTSSTNESWVSPAVGPAITSDGDLAATDEAGGVAEESARDSAGTALAPDAATDGRDIITSASATIVVDDVTASARVVGNAAVAHGGYVESMSVGTTGSMPVDGGVVYDERSYPYPYTPDGAWVNVRVPSDELPALIQELSDVGEVTSSSINRQDVTEQTVDLEARIAAAEASVARLTELMAQAGNLSDLIAAEAALSERQATLESYQQQLESLEGMVEMSSLSVSLVPEVATVEADPAGFTDGWAAGWNSMVATLNGIVIALGFLLPWLVVIGVIGLMVWGVVRLARRRSRGGYRSDTPQE